MGRLIGIILITGVTGFLGGVHLANILENEDINPNEIRILMMKHENKEPYKKLGVDVFIGDLQDSESLKGIMDDVTTVYHNAAIVINDACSREVMMKVNYQGTISLAEEFLNENTTEKFVFASSFGVYGLRFPKVAICENHPVNPVNNYQESKYLAEKYIIELSKDHSVNSSAIRNSLILGPGDKVTSLRISSGLINGQIPYMGNGKNMLSAVDVRDSSTAMILTSKNPVSKGQIYNVKSFDVTQKEYFDSYAKACGDCFPKKKYPYWLVYLFAWYKELSTPKNKEVLITRTRVDRYCNCRILDTTKIENELGFKPKYSNFDEVINESVQWLIENNYIQI